MTDKRPTDKIVATTAHIISDVFSPILMPTFAMAAVMWLTIMAYLPLGARLKALAGIFAVTAIIPFLFILLMIKLGKINDASISDRRQRVAPYCVAIVCYIAAALLLKSMSAPYWLPTFFFCAAAISVLSLIITHWWKISAHTGAVGGVAAYIYWLGAHGMLMYPIFWFCFSLVVAGLVGWSRLYLGRHTVMQVFAGAIMAFVLEYILLSI